MKKNKNLVDEIKEDLTGKDRARNLKKALIYKEILERPKFRRSR